ncbi:hypothetical protein [Actinoplanes sp. DH11]|uniref:hypothetical protein n=1 Tax=Actinoplanes sp. DH11 TaxID=2857011 RepID=UPI001E2A5836|nr:hypothetical protein [Actinoplanes sp. DH11]
MPDRPVALVPAEPVDLAAVVAAPPLDNLRRIGGEMFSWSDRDAKRGPAQPSGGLLRYLLAAQAGPGRTVLVAGPHSDELIDVLAGSGASVTWLLRSLVDAEEVAAAYPAVTVLAGTLGKLEPDQFDLVVAVDGVSRLNSAEGEQMPVGAMLDRLALAVNADGTLILMHDNHFGVHHTVHLGAESRQGSDADWYPTDELDAGRPASRTELTGRLTDAGLVVEASYAAFPDPAAPAVLIGERILGDTSSPLRPWLGSAVAQAFTTAYRGRPVLSDPRRLAGRALRAGAEDAVACGWLVVATGSEESRFTGHDVLVGDVHGTFTYGVNADSDPELLVPLTEPVERAGLRRTGMPAVAAADGYLLEDRLLELCAANDVRRLRQEVIQFEEWIRDQARDGMLSGRVAVADVSDVLITRDGPVVLSVRWEPTEPVPVGTALVRSLWQFAVRLITGARPHPWPITSSAMDLTTILLGMAGRGVTEPELRTAVDLQVAIDSAELGLRPAEQHDHKLNLLAVQPGTVPVDVVGYRELTEALWRQRYHTSHLLHMMEWTEDIIASRDRWLSKMDWEIQFYRASWAGRALTLSRTAYRLISRDLRAARQRRRQRRTAAAASRRWHKAQKAKGLPAQPDE